VTLIRSPTLLHQRNNVEQINVEVFEGFARYALPLYEHAKKNVLGADDPMTELPRLFGPARRCGAHHR
jgi:hypothetical protein